MEGAGERGIEARRALFCSDGGAPTEGACERGTEVAVERRVGVWPPGNAEDGVRGTSAPRKDSVGLLAVEALMLASTSARLMP